MRQRLPWGDLQLVLAVGDGGSLSAAARALGLDHSTLHRRIGGMEARLGVRLFERSRAGYAPTAAGEALIGLSRRIEADAAAVETQLAGEDMRASGIVRITTSDTLLVSILTPAILALRRSHPDVVVETTTTSRAVSLTRREADIALRVTDDPPEHLMGRRIGEVITAVYGAPAYLDGLARTPGLEPPDRNGYDWVGFDDDLSHFASARWMAGALDAERVVYRSDTLLGIADAVRQGLGVALLPHVLARGSPALRPVRPSPGPTTTTGVWLLTHRAIARAARIRVVMQELATVLAPALDAAHDPGETGAV